MYWMIWYLKKEEFNFNGVKDILELQAKEFKLKRLSGGAMELRTDNNIYVQYAYTVVFKKDLKARKITLNTNWYYTVTSKKWINKYLPGFIDIFQMDYIWYVSIKWEYPRGKKQLREMVKSGEVVEYRDGMVINY